MRLVLLSGPGGSGTTTMTAATAAAAAAAAGSGRRVLAVGCDPGLADVLGVALGDTPCAVDGGWSAVQVDVLARTEARWSEIRPRLAPLLRRGGPLLPSAEELLPPPGVAELVTLAALHDWTGSGEWDLVLVDAGPPAQALRLISSAASLRWHLGRWLPAHHRATLSGLLTLAGRGDAASDLVTRLDGALIEAERLLAGPGVSVRGVTSTRSLSLAGVRRLAAAVSVHGLLLDGVVVNRIDPAGGSDRGEILAGLPSWTVAERETEPLGTGPVGVLGAQCYGGADPAAPSGERAGPGVERDGARFVLDLPLPHVARDELGLTRCGDDLVLTVAGHRRQHPLAGVLTRCTVDGAELVGGRLRVWFRPDPMLWPDSVPLPTEAAR